MGGLYPPAPWENPGTYGESSVRRGTGIIQSKGRNRPVKNISEHSRFRTRLQAIVVVISICITLSSCKKSVENPTPLAPGERGQIAHQIPGRDLSLNPPQTGEVTLSRMDKPTDQVNAILTVKYNERNLPTVLKVCLLYTSRCV